MRKKCLIAACGVLAVLLIFMICVWFKFSGQLKAVSTVQRLEDGLYSLEYAGDYGFDDFIAQGGASSDSKMGDYIIKFLSGGFYKLEHEEPDGGFGCSTLCVKKDAGGVLFGRNYDWEKCDAMIVHTKPENGYESVSTCCLDFLGFGDGWKPEGMRNQFMALAAVYAPLDGMNSEGLMVADLVAGDKAKTHQDTEKPDITTVSAIRLLLDHAATVDEAIAMLEECDMNSSIDSAHHFAIADKNGRSVAVEYIDNKMIVTESKILTNHYLAGEKAGVGSEQSHKRFEMLESAYQLANGTMDKEKLSNAMQSVSQGSLAAEYEKTCWTCLYDPDALTVSFYWMENYEKPYSILLGEKDGRWLSN